MSVFRPFIIMAAVAAGVGANFMPAPSTSVPPQQVTRVEKWPLVTAAATAFHRLLGRRATNVCGYIDGAYSAWCVNPYSCFYNETASAAGCCTASDCTIPTACQPSISPLPSNTDLTKYCSYSASPSCLSLIYSDGPCLGCTWFVCDTDGGRMAILTTRNRGVSTTSPSPPPPTTPPPKPDPNPKPTPLPSSQAPTGAIVGGVVGGVAAVALVGHLLFFLHRRRKPKGSGSEQEFTPETQGGNGTPEDVSSTRARSGMANTSTAPSSPSPPSHYQHSIAGTNWSASPAAMYPSSYVDQQLMPQQHFQDQQSWYPSPPPQEMATTQPGRSVPEMQEMPGNSQALE